MKRHRTPHSSVLTRHLGRSRSGRIPYRRQPARCSLGICKGRHGSPNAGGAAGRSLPSPPDGTMRRWSFLDHRPSPGASLGRPILTDSIEERKGGRSGANGAWPAFPVCSICYPSCKKGNLSVPPPHESFLMGGQAKAAAVCIPFCIQRICAALPEKQPAGVDLPPAGGSAAPRRIVGLLLQAGDPARRAGHVRPGGTEAGSSR